MPEKSIAQLADVIEPNCWNRRIFMAKRIEKPQLASAENYDHKEQQALIRPDVGLQARVHGKRGLNPSFKLLRN
jgi:hypothetical protein